MSFSDAERIECQRLIQWGLAEDLGTAGDITSKSVLVDARTGQASIVARSSGVIAGLPALPMIAEMFDRAITVTTIASDGPVEQKTTLAVLAGPIRSVLAIERLALNFLGRLSGVASLTAQYVAAVNGTSARICDTRKTTPGWRYLEKYAVRIGGGINHRIGLHDWVLIKDNHLAELARRETHPIRAAVARARAAVKPGVVVEVEVDTLDQLNEALACRPDIILLDNMHIDSLIEAVARRNATAPQVELEASGGVDLSTVASIARTGVDRISVGALTHSAKALDVALDFVAGEST